MHTVHLLQPVLFSSQQSGTLGDNARLAKQSGQNIQNASSNQVHFGTRQADAFQTGLGWFRALGASTSVLGDLVTGLGRQYLTGVHIPQKITEVISNGVTSWFGAEQQMKVNRKFAQDAGKALTNSFKWAALLGGAAGTAVAGVHIAGNTASSAAVSMWNQSAQRKLVKQLEQKLDGISGKVFQGAGLLGGAVLGGVAIHQAGNRALVGIKAQSEKQVLKAKAKAEAKLAKDKAKEAIRESKEKAEIEVKKEVDKVKALLEHTVEEIDLAKADPRFRFENIFGQQAAIDKAQLIIKCLKHPEQTRRLLNKTANDRLILPFTMTGPPGVGKTQLVRALAAELHQAKLNVALILLHADQLEHKDIGPRAVEHFKQVLAKLTAEGKLPIVFIDEIDSVGSRDSGDSKSTINALLKEIDGVKELKGEPPLLIAATNLPEQLDTAIRSRFKDEMSFTLPDSATRNTLYDHYLHKVSNLEAEADVNLGKIAELSKGFSGRDISGIAELMQEKLLKDVDLSKPPQKLTYSQAQLEELVQNMAVKVRSMQKQNKLAADNQL